MYLTVFDLKRNLLKLSEILLFFQVQPLALIGYPSVGISWTFSFAILEGH